MLTITMHRYIIARPDPLKTRRELGLRDRLSPGALATEKEPIIGPQLVHDDSGEARLPKSPFLSKMS